MHPALRTLSVMPSLRLLSKVEAPKHFSRFPERSIVLLQYQPSPPAFPYYANFGNNDRWITIQNCQTEDLTNLVQFWKYANIYITHTINHVDEDKLGDW